MAMVNPPLEFKPPPKPTTQQNQQQQYNPTVVNRSVHVPSQHQYPPPPQPYVQPYKNVANPSTSNITCCCQLKTALYIIAVLNLVSEFISCIYFGVVYRNVTRRLEGNRHEGNRYEWTAYGFGHSFTPTALLTITICCGFNFVASIGFLISLANTLKPLFYASHLIGWILNLIVFIVYSSQEYFSVYGKRSDEILFIISILLFALYHGYESIQVYYYLVKTLPEFIGIGPAGPPTQTPSQVVNPETRTLHKPVDAGQQNSTYGQHPPSYRGGNGH